MRRELTFGLGRDFSFRFYRDGGRLEDLLVQRRELVEVVAILLLSRAPREVHIADFGRNHRQITVERWIAQQMRNATVLDGENPQRVPAEHLHLLLADPNREIAGRLVCLVLVILLIVMGQIMMFMSSDGDLSEEENVKDREDDERSHYECLESVKRKTVTQSGARPRKRREEKNCLFIEKHSCQIKLTRYTIKYRSTKRSGCCGLLCQFRESTHAE